MSSLTGKQRRFSLEAVDCMDGMKGLKNDSVDVVVTSPPYNIGKDYRSYDDRKTHQDYLDWCREWSMEVARVLKPDGSFYLNMGSVSSNPFLAFEVASVVRETLKLQNVIHWIKAISIEEDGITISRGHFKPVNSDRYLNHCHEYLFHFSRTGWVKLDRLAVGVPYADKSNIARWSHTRGKDKRCRGNTWFVPYQTIQRRAKQRPHPATFPVELAVKCIRLHGKPNAVVLDPFLGIGHSALAALECSDLVSEFIGFDIDEEYIATAKKALADMEVRFKSDKTSRKALLGNDERNTSSSEFH